MKKIRLTRTMVIEYVPDPENYPEGYSVEQMANLDAKADDYDLLFTGDLMKDSVSFEVIEEEA